MNKLTSLAFFFLAAGILTSVSILSAYQILFSIALAYYTYLSFKSKTLALPKSAYWLLAFLIVASITTILNFDLMPKPDKNFGRLKYFLYGIVGIYVFRYWIKETPDKIKKIIIHTFLLSVVVAGVWALGVYVFTDEKRARPLTETMRYGYGSAMLLLSLISAYLNREKLKELVNSKFLLTAIIIGFGGMFFTYTRGALLGFLCGLPFVLYFYKKRMVIWGLVASGVVLGVLGGFYLFGTQTNTSFRLLSTKGFSSDEIRLSQWQSAVIAVKERPYFGWGLSNFHTQVERIKNTYDLGAKQYVDAHSHNVFLEIAAGTGLVGLFLFLAWLFTWAYESFKSREIIKAIVVPFGVALVTSGQFEVILDANNASMIFALYSFSSAFAQE